MPPRRLIVLDVLRGFFILYVIILHGFTGVVYGNHAEALEKLPLWLIIVFAPFLLLSTWAPVFVVISGIAQAYVLSGLVFQKDPSKPLSLRNFFGGALVTSLFLYMLSFMNMALFHHPMDYAGKFRYTFVTGALHNGAWLPLDFHLVFYNDALGIIAINGLLVTVMLYLLWKLNCLQRTRRAGMILGLTTAFIFLLSPFLHSRLDPLFFTALDERRIGLALFLKFFVGVGFSTFPYAAYGMIGMILGLFLAKHKEAKWLRHTGYDVATAMIVSGVVLTIMTGFEPKDVIHHPYPFNMQLIVLGTILLTCLWLMLRLEYCTEEQRARRAKRTLWLRRFGLLALTIFCCESVFSMLLSIGYRKLFGYGDFFPKNPLLISFFISLNVLFWSVVLKNWEKIDFKYSIEWWISRIAGMVRGRPSVRLQADAILYQPCVPIRTTVTPCVAKADI